MPETVMAGAGAAWSQMRPQLRGFGPAIRLGAHRAGARDIERGEAFRAGARSEAHEAPPIWRVPGQSSALWPCRMDFARQNGWCSHSGTARWRSTSPHASFGHGHSSSIAVLGGQQRPEW
jgi:hypothetical protein